jgi:hypothetical protein
MMRVGLTIRIFGPRIKHRRIAAHVFSDAFAQSLCDT